MQTFLLEQAHWISVLHVLAVISWMAAQLYLPRLFVYHCQATIGGEASTMLKLMERRLLKFIMTPAMIASLIFGLLLVWAKPNLATQSWFSLKMMAVFVLFATHGLCARAVRQFALDQNLRSVRFYRILNEVPTLAMILALVCVIGLRAYPAFIK